MQKNSALWFGILSILCVKALFAQSPEPEETPRDALIKIINACNTSQSERWKTGIDLAFKDIQIGSDIRIGERGPLGKITFVGRDTIDIYRHGDTQRKIASIPAKLDAKSLYSLVVVGSIEEASASVDIVVIREDPLPERSKVPGKARVLFVNGVDDYQIGVSFGNSAPQVLAPLQQLESFHDPGELDLGLWFTDSNGKKQRIQSGILLSQNESITAVIYASAERGDRPSLLVLNPSEDLVRAREAEFPLEAAEGLSPKK